VEILNQLSGCLISCTEIVGRSDEASAGTLNVLLQANSKIVPWTRPRPLPSIAFPIHYSPSFIRRRRLLFLWLYSPLMILGRFFSLLILYTVGRTPWTGDQPVARPLPTHRTTQTQNKRIETCLEWDSNPRSQCSSERRQFCDRPTLVGSIVK
jgi:hypothetical protein